MRLWIIGKRGMLAQAFKRKCLEKGIDCIATSQKEVDVRNPQALKAQFETLDFNYVINCSGYTAVDRAEGDKEAAYALNVEAVKQLAELSAIYKKKLIHFSTDYVFDGEDKHYEEEAQTAPLSVYGETKEQGEKVLFAHCSDACLIRTSWLFGQEGNHFVEKMVELMGSKESIEVVNDQWGRPTYCDDLVEATLSILGESGIFHFANEGVVTWYEWAEVIKEKLKKRNIPIQCQAIHPISKENYKKVAFRPKSAILLTKKFNPPHWEVGLDEVLAKLT